MLELYRRLSGEEQQAFDMGEIYGGAKAALRWSRQAVADSPQDIDAEESVDE